MTHLSSVSNLNYFSKIHFSSLFHDVTWLMSNLYVALRTNFAEINHCGVYMPFIFILIAQTSSGISESLHCATLYAVPSLKTWILDRSMLLRNLFLVTPNLHRLRGQDNVQQQEAKQNKLGNIHKAYKFRGLQLSFTYLQMCVSFPD